MEAGKSIQSQEGTERCLRKPDGKTVVSSFGTRAGADWHVSRALARPNNKCALEAPHG